MNNKLKVIHKSAKIFETADFDEDKSCLSTKIKPSDWFFYPFIALVFAYIGFSIFRVADFSQINVELAKLQVLNTVFLSILMQAFPFVLIGVFVSSIIQVFISSETIVKLFPRRMGMGYIVAMLAGTLFPVCDCGIVPVAARLIKKGVPVATAVTFMLSAPIVNPIVIMSTLYAFPGQPFIAFYRVLFGLMVALAVGLTLYFYSDGQSLLINKLDDFGCNCGHCSEESLHIHGFGRKFASIFHHAGTEFFEVGKYLIIGALISSIMQTMLPKSVFIQLGNSSAVSLLIMMAMALLMSVCSTSDAFIARTFLNQFSLGSVMGFLVLGPMIDVKNILMLLSSFKKGFVPRLVVVILGWAFTVLFFINPIL